MDGHLYYFVICVAFQRLGEHQGDHCFIGFARLKHKPRRRRCGERRTRVRPCVPVYATLSIHTMHAALRAHTQTATEWAGPPRRTAGRASAKQPSRSRHVVACSSLRRKSVWEGQAPRRSQTARASAVEPAAQDSWKGGQLGTPAGLRLPRPPRLASIWACVRARVGLGVADPGARRAWRRAEMASASLRWPPTLVMWLLPAAAARLLAAD